MSVAGEPDRSCAPIDLTRDAPLQHGKLESIRPSPGPIASVPMRQSSQLSAASVVRGQGNASVSIVGPSPSKHNPFARKTAANGGSADSSFGRSSILPTLRSPLKPIGQVSGTSPTVALPNSHSTPAGKVAAAATSVAKESQTKSKQAWRLLWRGGLEIGREGWRLEGLTFFARLTFPSTPSTQLRNPFDTAPLASTEGQIPPPGGSPFALPNADTDLCLSLESMRGRKYLQVRGVEAFSDNDIVESSDDASTVQMSIAPGCPILAGYFTSVLCEGQRLTPKGRTEKAVAIGLGDDDSPNSTLLVYGQLPSGAGGEAGPWPRTLKLLVGRKRAKPPPGAAHTVKPGDPLPRAPMYVEEDGNAILSTLAARSGKFRRSASVASVAGPSRLPATNPAWRGGSALPPAPVSGRTPGRRGEKRQKDTDADDEENRRRRKAGRIVPMALPKPPSNGNHSTDHASASNPAQPKSRQSTTAGAARKPPEPPPDEDIFGKKPKSRPAAKSNPIGPGQEAEPSVSNVPSDTPDGQTAPKPPKKDPKQAKIISANKDSIRKWTAVMLDAAGIARDHVLFKEIFGIVTKGSYFGLRDDIQSEDVPKYVIKDMIQRHLDIYL